MPLAFVDLSAQDGAKTRSVRVLQRKDFDVLTDPELRIETNKFVEAYLRVRSAETAESEEEKKRRDAGLPENLVGQ